MRPACRSPRKTDGSVFLGCKQDGCRPFCLGKFNNIHCQHVVHLVVLEFLSAGASLVLAEWTGRSSREVDSILCLGALV